MSAHYDVYADVVIQALIAEAKTDPDVIGLVLLWSRAIGGVGHDSDYDAIFVVTDEAYTRYEQTQTAPTRGTSAIPPQHARDIWNDYPSGMQIGKIESWYLPMFAGRIVTMDKKPFGFQWRYRSFFVNFSTFLLSEHSVPIRRKPQKN